MLDLRFHKIFTSPPRNMKYTILKQYLPLRSVWLWSVFLLLRLVDYSFWRWLLPQTARAELLVFFLFALPWIFHRKWYRAFLLIILTFLIEVVWHQSWMPFWTYVYQEPHSSLWLLGVPFFIPLAWLILLSSTFYASHKRYVWWVLLVIFDLLLEPFATQEMYRLWTQHDWFLTAPLQNYLSRFFLFYIFSYIVKQLPTQKKVAQYSLLALFFYVLTLLLI